MNVVLPKLLPKDYGRANYLKREMEHCRRYIVAAKKRGETGKAELLADYHTAAALFFRTAVLNPTNE